jgi:glycogen operon protein
MSSPTPGERLLAAISGDFAVLRGYPLPFGATQRDGGINFAVFSRHATGMTLVLFPPGETEPLVEFPLDPRLNRTGDV